MGLEGLIPQSFFIYWHIFAYIIVKNIIYYNFMKLVIKESCLFNIQVLHSVNEKLVGWNNA